jgi:hypothetical protein
MGTTGVVDALYCGGVVQRQEQLRRLKAERIAATQDAAHAEG